MSLGESPGRIDAEVNAFSPSRVRYLRELIDTHSPLFEFEAWRSGLIQMDAPFSPLHAPIYIFEDAESDDLQELAERLDDNAPFSRWVRPPTDTGIIVFRHQPAKGLCGLLWECDRVNVHFVEVIALKPDVDVSPLLALPTGTRLTVCNGVKMSWGAPFGMAFTNGGIPEPWQIRITKIAYSALSLLHEDVSRSLRIKASRPTRKRNPLHANDLYLSVQRAHVTGVAHWVRDHLAWFWFSRGLEQPERRLKMRTYSKPRKGRGSNGSETAQRDDTNNRQPGSRNGSPNVA